MFEQVIAQLMVGFALFAQPFGVEHQPADGVHGTTVKLPAVRRKQPGPANYFAWTHTGDGDKVVITGAIPDLDMARLDQVERSSTFPFPRQELTGRRRERSYA
jgi:hypothetical protein